MKQAIFIVASLLILTISSCQKEDENGSVMLIFEGVNQTLKSTQNELAAEVNITDFKLSIRDVEFKKDRSDLDSNQVEIRGPFDVDLMSETDALSQTIGTFDVPDGTYKVLRFKLHKSRDRSQSDPLYDRSLYLKGTIDGVPFEFWHDTSENFDIENSGGIVVSGNTADLTVQFVIDQFLNSLHVIDLSQATDENQNNLIEINPDDDDSNGATADKLKENIKEAADLIKQ